MRKHTPSSVGASSCQSLAGRICQRAVPGLPYNNGLPYILLEGLSRERIAAWPSRGVCASYKRVPACL